MGLTVDVGQLTYCLEHDPEGAQWIRADLEAIGRALTAAGLPTHVEPEACVPTLLPHTGSFPYSFLHTLRRAYAHTRPGRPPLTPAPDSFDPATDALIDEELTLFLDSHLCCHADTEGYYVPIDFEDILYADDVPGVMIGSTQVLERELLRVAPLLSIPLVEGTITETTARALMDTPESDPYHREHVVWLALFANARASLKHGCVISFN